MSNKRAAEIFYCAPCIIHCITINPVQDHCGATYCAGTHCPSSYSIDRSCAALTHTRTDDSSTHCDITCRPLDINTKTVMLLLTSCHTIYLDGLCSKLVSMPGVVLSRSSARRQHQLIFSIISS